MEKSLKIAIPLWKSPIENYKNALTGVGAEPVPVDIRCAPDEFDGLLLTGGCDVDPVRFRQELNGAEEIDRERDELEFTLLDRFVQSGKPVLGICRGHQVINIYFGGTLIQHIAEWPRHRRDAERQEDRVHAVRAVRESYIEKLYGTEFRTNSSHHQALDRIGAGLHAAAWSDDGVNEAVYHESLPVWGIQWHPERMCFAYRRDDLVDGSKVFRFFLEQCRCKRCGVRHIKV